MKEAVLKKFEIFTEIHLKQRKYLDICVPSSADESSGYHMDCYRRFTALVKQDRGYLVTLNEEQKKVSRSSTGAFFIATTSDVFVKQYIFSKKRIRNSKEQNTPLSLYQQKIWRKISRGMQRS